MPNIIFFLQKWPIYMLVQNISRGHEIFKTFWNFGAPYSPSCKVLPKEGKAEKPKKKLPWQKNLKDQSEMFTGRNIKEGSWKDLATKCNLHRLDPCFASETPPPQIFSQNPILHLHRWTKPICYLSTDAPSQIWLKLFTFSIVLWGRDPISWKPDPPSVDAWQGSGPRSWQCHITTTYITLTTYHCMGHNHIKYFHYTNDHHTNHCMVQISNITRKHW